MSGARHGCNTSRILYVLWAAPIYTQQAMGLVWRAKDIGGSWTASLILDVHSHLKISPQLMNTRLTGPPLTSWAACYHSLCVDGLPAIVGRVCTTTPHLVACAHGERGDIDRTNLNSTRE
ncbi:hypothetical protein C8Q79DRAFT_438326 [Trametes meyenii]|nr:hypothetical protein C8Q79DRAFT_438326 [Trametes meyenii]